MMMFERGLAVCFLVIQLVTLSGSNEKVFDTYFNGFCYWSEEVSYHVHYLSGCKVYFTCHRGKFLDFHKCPESKIFNAETLRCEDDGICKDGRSTNPTYEDWWKKIAGVIDKAIEALDNSSSLNQNIASSTTAEATQNDISASATVFPLSTMISQSKFSLLKSFESSDKDQSFSKDIENNQKVRGSMSLSHVTKSASDSTKEIVSSNPVPSIPTLDTVPSHSTARPFETATLSLHIIPMQFDTQTSLLTERLSSSATPKPLLQEGISKEFVQSNLPYLAFSANSTDVQNFFHNFIIPLVAEIAKNSTIMSAVTRLFDVLFETAHPIMYQILDQQVDEKQGSAIIISLKDLKHAYNQTTFVALPILGKIVRYVTPYFLRKAIEKNDIFNDYFLGDDFSVIDSFPSVLMTVLEFIFKYHLLGKTSPSDQLKTFSLMEIRKDMKNVFGIFSNAFGFTSR